MYETWIESLLLALVAARAIASKWEVNQWMGTHWLIL